MIDITKPSFLFVVMLVVFSSSLLLEHATALPTTGAATMVGTNNATIGCTGTAGNWYVQYGETNPGYWRTSDQSGVTSTTIRGGFFGSSQYYYTCCDATGCGSTGTFTTGVVTPLPTYNLGAAYRNISQNNFDIPTIGKRIIDPYIWNPNMPMTIVFMLMFSPVFIGIWLRSRTVLVALVFGFIISSFVLFNNGSSGLGISMPPELVSLCQAFCYISFAGCIIYVIHK